MTSLAKPPNDAALVRLLRAAQSAYGYLSPEILESLASSAGAHIGDVLRIYGSMPHLQAYPGSRDEVLVCTGKHCQNAGAATLAGKMGRRVRRVPCLGCCQKAPAVVKNGRVARARLEQLQPA
ncbi:MAG: NAD(P)H-dependent oxidoreductase subunit E [Bryobacterales bacterium]|nr:NAD(P)H-dependent oxidoreductase subunit E [Bryobacterales bacterium]